MFMVLFRVPPRKESTSGSSGESDTARDCSNTDRTLVASTDPIEREAETYPIAFLDSPFSKREKTCLYRRETDPRTG